jgi:hypothetical protein
MIRTTLPVSVPAPMCIPNGVDRIDNRSSHSYSSKTSQASGSRASLNDTSRTEFHLPRHTADPAAHSRPSQPDPVEPSLLTRASSPAGRGRVVCRSAHASELRIPAASGINTYSPCSTGGLSWFGRGGRGTLRSAQVLFCVETFWRRVARARALGCWWWWCGVRVASPSVCSVCERDGTGRDRQALRIGPFRTPRRKDDRVPLSPSGTGILPTRSEFVLRSAVHGTLRFLSKR